MNDEIRYKKITTAPETPDVVQTRDVFETPNYAVDLIIPYINGLTEVTSWWEPAAGNGKIVNRLKQSGINVPIRTDIRFPEQNEIYNFILDEMKTLPKNCGIITNPPYSIKAKFVERCFEYDVPFALLISAEYSGRTIDWVKRGCEKVIPNRRIDYITPSGRSGVTSSSQFHTMWLTYKFRLGATEIFVDLPKNVKENV